MEIRFRLYSFGPSCLHFWKHYITRDTAAILQPWGQSRCHSKPVGDLWWVPPTTVFYQDSTFCTSSTNKLCLCRSLYVVWSSQLKLETATVDRHISLDGTKWETVGCFGGSGLFKCFCFVFFWSLVSILPEDIACFCTFKFCLLFRFFFFFLQFLPEFYMNSFM